MPETAKKAAAKKTTPAKKTAAKKAAPKRNKRNLKTKKQNFTFATSMDKRRKIGPPSTYLDQVTRNAEEDKRAKAEGRKPDYDKAGAGVGDVVKPTHVIAKEVNASNEVPVDATLPVVDNG